MKPKVPRAKPLKLVAGLARSAQYLDNLVTVADCARGEGSERVQVRLPITVRHDGDLVVAFACKLFLVKREDVATRGVRGARCP